MAKFQEKMRVLLCAFFFVTLHARDQKLTDNDDDEDSPLQRKVDVFPQPFKPVPFGHITLEGIEDPNAKQKPPVDLLELDMIVPHTPEEAIAMLKKGRKNIQFIGLTPTKGPRDRYLAEMPLPPQNATELKWFNFPETLRQNIMNPSKSRARVNGLPDRKGYPPPSPPGDPSKAELFDKYSFQLKSEVEQTWLNWTTCDQFAVKAVFSPKHVIDREWVPFYIWSKTVYRYAIVHKFKYPTVKTVDEYKLLYNTIDMKTKIDWSQPKLLMQGTTEMLLIAVDRKGLFDAIPKHEIPDSVKKGKQKAASMPSLSIRMKIEDPYLVMMFCEDYYAVVMAIAGTEPTKYKEMKLEAASIKFTGTGRPVWRDLEAEAEHARLLAERKIEEEEAKFVDIGGLMNGPRMDDEDVVVK